MSDNDTSSSILRSHIFVLIDGSFVVKWSENRVQELLTGQYRKFERRDFGAHITDFELNQLKNAGIVEQFDKENVWLSPSLENSRYYQRESERVRAYYLHTTLTSSEQGKVESTLEYLGLAGEFFVRVRDDFVIVVGSQGRSFSTFDEAEEARVLLVTESPEIFDKTVVAFVETTRRDT